ncbi:hypothetical protein C5E06_09635 [Pseudoclavibacter sp. RFBI5]|uniref:hypothetical protein n=1 Tax=Pseudoclavibacter sp. RFBI5 TaxID=2080578 RepID=UPI000CE73437|nr:hypothetical protein [Pseudoclavibacter sp. RFBI5]PPG02705.1 hypothetical protein C5E06_09635 [Pseudoclavibacter sp. RFBI5]
MPDRIHHLILDVQITDSTSPWEVAGIGLDAHGRERWAFSQSVRPPKSVGEHPLGDGIFPGLDAIDVGIAEELTTRAAPGLDLIVRTGETRPQLYTWLPRTLALAVNGVTTVNPSERPFGISALDVRTLARAFQSQLRRSRVPA